MTQEKFIVEEEYSEGEHPESLAQTLRIETDLFKKEDFVPNKIVEVHLIDLPKNNEDWKIIDDNQEMLTLKGMRFTNKEREFLRTPKGFLFIIDGYKKGWRTIAKFKREIKGHL